MDQKWIHMLMMLVFYQGVSSGVVVDVTPKEGDPVEISCTPPLGGTLVIWLRVLDTPDVEFIGSFAPSSGTEKEKIPDRFDISKASHDKLTLRSFKKNESGIYTCATLKSNALHFGRLTRLVVGEFPQIVTVAPPITTSKKDEAKTTTACVCNTSTKSGGSGFSTFCNPIILGALAGSCGLLLLLLIIISVYCSRIRTRRCPHHYKRKPRTPAPGKQMMANRHV
ncbi:T-cell surface glycoprotein CD8 alpha chain [Scomber japonicus]|uniref:T-cell surface glycoprotein CD8 alpha chain n=1 Tax=Scomber japonicus TaxID=13676 RepID=UPI0023067456|nr:T-cell surface glycoprotein CD8 alpha chain [Scomber japonicus]